jgi:outer membrane protein TolC
MRNRLKIVASLLILPLFSFGQEILPLDDAIRIGLENSYSIQIAQNNLQVSKNNNTLGNAGILPRVDAVASQSNSFQNRYFESSNEVITKDNGYPTYSLNSAIQLNWSLFDGFGMFIRKEKLGIYEQQSELFLRMAIENTVADIAFTYYNIALNANLLKTYEDQMDLSRQRLKIAREKSLIGVGYELQELQSEVDFRADSARYIRQGSYLINLKAELNRLLSRQPDVDFFVNTEIPVPDAANTSDIFLMVKEFNPSILNARLQNQVGELDLEEARSSRYPTVNLASAYNFSNVGTPNSQNTVLSRLHGPSLGIGASITLFNGYNARRRVENSKILSRNYQLNEEELMLRLQSSAFKMVNNLNQAIELVKVEEKSVRLAQRNAEAAWEKYRLGAISDIELRENQIKLLDAQTRLISSQMSAQAAEIEIRALTGEMGKFLLNGNK